MIKFRDLMQEGQSLFQKKMGVDSLHQDIAESFYPERANFTSSHIMGEEFATHLYSSYPLLARRELGDALSTFSRPQGQEWFSIGVKDKDRETHAAKIWLEQKTEIQRRAVFDTSSRFVRSMKEGDHDWVTFGQCALSVELNRDRSGLLYRNHHLRDMAWSEGYNGDIDRFWRKWKPTNWQLKQIFGADSLHPDRNRSEKKNETANCMHVFVPGEYADSNAPFVSYYIDVDYEKLIERKEMNYGYYVLPRWVTVSDSQYAYSPAVVCGLPDARLYQDMTRVLLEAGQRQVDPPMVAVEDAINSGVDLQAGGVTMVSATYDERLGSVLRPVAATGTSNLGFGLEMSDRVQLMLSKAFYLDKLNLPRGQEMTATEASIRFQEYVRTILPIFEPKEQEMEGAVMNLTFDILLAHGVLGATSEIPQSLLGEDIQFDFVSPLSKSLQEKDRNVFNDVVNVMAAAAQLDPSALANLNMNQATRDAIEGTGAPTEWLSDERQVFAAQRQAQEQQQAEQGLALTQQAKEVMQPNA